MNNFHFSFLISIFLACNASAGWLSGPSGMQAGEAIEVVGGDFTPDSTLQLDITGPAGTTTTLDIIVAADGSVSQTLDFPQAGDYIAEGWDETNGGETPDASAVIVIAN